MNPFIDEGSLRKSIAKTSDDCNLWKGMIYDLYDLRKGIPATGIEFGGIQFEVAGWVPDHCVFYVSNHDRTIYGFVHGRDESLLFRLDPDGEVEVDNAARSTTLWEKKE